MANGNIDYGAAASDLFSGAGDAFSGVAGGAGSYAAGNEYQLAAALTQSETNTKLEMANRGIYKASSATQAQVGGAGFALSGSAQDLMRSNAQQGALTKAVVLQQGMIQQSAYTAQWKAANAAAHGQEGGGILKAVGEVAAVAAMFL